MPAARLAGTLTPASMSMPLIIGQNASRPARDRSIPLMTMTNVIPTAQMPMMDDCLTTLRRFDRSRKCGTCEPRARKAATGISSANPRRAAERYVSQSQNAHLRASSRLVLSYTMVPESITLGMLSACFLALRTASRFSTAIVPILAGN